jgi:hypothetical protein
MTNNPFEETLRDTLNRANLTGHQSAQLLVNCIRSVILKFQ